VLSSSCTGIKTRHRTVLIVDGRPQDHNRTYLLIVDQVLYGRESSSLNGSRASDLDTASCGVLMLIAVCCKQQASKRESGLVTASSSLDYIHSSSRRVTTAGHTSPSDVVPAARHALSFPPSTCATYVFLSTNLLVRVTCDSRIASVCRSTQSPAQGDYEHSKVPGCSSPQPFRKFPPKIKKLNLPPFVLYLHALTCILSYNIQSRA
jgi:hypothetical protein